MSDPSWLRRATVIEPKHRCRANRRLNEVRVAEWARELALQRRTWALALDHGSDHYTNGPRDPECEVALAVSDPDGSTVLWHRKAYCHEVRGHGVLVAVFHEVPWNIAFRLAGRKCVSFRDEVAKPALSFFIERFVAELPPLARIGRALDPEVT